MHRILFENSEIRWNHENWGMKCLFSYTLTYPLAFFVCAFLRESKMVVNVVTFLTDIQRQKLRSLSGHFLYTLESSIVKRSGINK